MYEFAEKTLTGMSVKECDEYALACKPLLSLGGGYIHTHGRVIINDDYEAGAVGTGGVGNHGCMVLYGRTPRARQIIREGKILKLTRGGFPWVLARRAVRVRFGMEPEVIRCAEVLHLKGKKTRDRSILEYECGHPGLSWPRWEAVLKILGL